MKKKARHIALVTLLVVFSSCCDNDKIENGYYFELPTCEQFAFPDGDTMTVNCEIAQWYDGKKKAVVFTWDDCTHNIKGVREVFDDYGLKTTFYVNTAEIDNTYLKFRLFYKGTLNGVIEDVLENGHEVGSHTHDHVNLTKLTLSQVEEQLKKSSNSIFEKYGFYPSTLSHPNSCYNESIDSLMRLYFLDSRYSVHNDADTTIRYFQVRTSYPLAYYKDNFDSFIESAASMYVYGGHQLEGGYEPIGGGRETLSTFLKYINDKYESICWITTFEDAVMYRLVRENVVVSNNKGYVTIDISKIKDYIKRFTHPHVLLTLKFDDMNLDFESEGLICNRYDGRNSYCTIDLRKTNKLRYITTNKHFSIQNPMRNGQKM